MAIAHLRHRLRTRKRYLLIGAVILAGILVISLAGYYIWAATGLYAVEVDGRVLGLTRDRGLPARLVKQLSDEARAARGLPVRLEGKLVLRRAGQPVTDDGEVQATADAAPQDRWAAMPSRGGSRPAVLSPEELKAALKQALPLVAQAWVITVDGRPVVGLADRAQAEAAVSELLEDYKATLTKRGGVTLQSATMREKVEVVGGPVRVNEVRTKDQAKAILLRGTDEVRVYEVKPNDSLWAIANASKTTVESLRQANPELARTDIIHIGQKINLLVAAPYVHLRSTETMVYRESIPYVTEITDDPSRWPWEEIVTRKGLTGLREITKEIVRENGAIVDQRVVNVATISEPVAAQVVHGVKIIPDLGTGSLAWPILGHITSGFGYRRGGEFHPGVDIGAPMGTPAFAADSGTVVQAESHSWGYGKVIVIDHGGGRLLTLYGHLSVLLVRPGDVVSKGQVIAYSGNTGRSTGPHLHFEVRVDGKPVNPLQFYPR